jgi:hypothetical protein
MQIDIKSTQKEFSTKSLNDAPSETVTDTDQSRLEDEKKHAH